MLRTWWVLALAAALDMMVGAGLAGAQTVIVAGAPAGSTVELVLNAGSIGTAKVEAGQDPELALDLTTLGKPDPEAQIYVDSCGDTFRVLLVERGMTALPRDPKCERTQIAGWFLIRRGAFLTVNVTPPIPRVRLRPRRDRIRPPGAPPGAPSGILVFGGAGYTRFLNTIDDACAGAVGPCSGEDSGFAFTVGADWWMTRFFGVHASYVKPADVTISATEETLSATAFLEGSLIVIAGKAGVPLGPVRPYAIAGTNYHRSTSGNTLTVEGETQSFRQENSGWSLVLGGGAEVWLAPRVAAYVEAGRARITDKNLAQGETEVDERLGYVFAGVRIRVGGN